MNYRFLFLIFFLNTVVSGQDVPKELQTYLDQLEKEYKTDKDEIISYSTDWYQRINDILTGMDGFSEEDKRTITREVLAVEKKIKPGVTKALKELEDEHTKYKKEMDNIVTQEKEKKISLSNAQASMSRFFQQEKEAIAGSRRELHGTIEQQLRRPEIIYKEKKRVINIKQAQEKAEKKRKYDEKMRKFLMSIAKYFQALEKANEAGRKVLINYVQTKKIDSAGIVNTTHQYTNLLNQFDTAYKQNKVPVSFDSKTNYVSIALRRLMNFYLDDISMTLKIAKHLNNELTRKKESKLPYYAYFFNLAERIGGTGTGKSSVEKGYDGQIAEFAKHFFPAQSDAVIHYFAQKKKAMSIDAFGNALWDFSVNVVNPTQTALNYALAMYKEIMSDLALVDDTQAQNLAKQAQGYMAAIYLNLALTTLKKMEPKKDNSALLTIVIDSYQQASSYFDKAGDAADAQEYSNLGKNLKTAQEFNQQAQQAEKQKNIGQAVYLYQKAFKAFSVGGDAVDATQIEDKANKLNAEVKVKEAQATLNDFIAQNKTQLQSYMAYISSANVEETVQLSGFADMLSALSSANSSAVESYKSAIASLEKLEKPINELENTVLFLQYLVDGLKHLAEGDTFADIGTQENLETAEYIDYPQALFNARKADALYTKAVAQYAPVFPSVFATDQLNTTLKKNQQWNFEILFNRHCAKKYSEMAPTLEDQLLIVQYLAAADGTRMIYVSSEMETTLSTSLEKIISSTETFKGLLKQAEEKQAIALKLPATDWQQNKKVPHFYLSKGDAMWQDVLKRFATLYRFSKNSTKVREDFLNAVVAYAKSYQSGVPKEFYPSIGTAIIHYRQFILYTIENETENAANALQTIGGFAKTFFESIKSLEKQIENPDLITSATDNQKKVVEWKNRFEQAVSRQNAIIAEFSPTTDPKALQLFSFDVDIKTGNVTCKMQQAGQSALESVTIPNPELKLADIYKKLGDSLYKKADYRGAYYAYYYARRHYNNAGKLDAANEANELYKKAYTRSIYHAYLELVVPNKTYQHAIKMVEVAGVSVPHHYELYNDVQVIPTDKIPLPTNLSNLAHDKSAQAGEHIQNLLLGYAYLLFLDKKLTDVGIDYAKVVKGGTQLRSLEEINQEFSKDDLPLVISIVESANYYQKKLQERIKKKESSFHLIEGAKGEFILGISYQTLLATTAFISNPYMTQKPYKAYYPADTYYSAIRVLSDPNKDEVIYASRSFVSGNEENIYNAALSDLGESNLVSAGAYERRLDYLMKGGSLDDVDPSMGYEEMATLTGAQEQIKALKAVKKDDFSVKISHYQQPIDIFKSYSKGVVGSYYNSAYGYYEQKKGSKEMGNINKALSTFYLSAGDELQLFLIGDPQAAAYFYGSGTSYGGLIVDIQNFYQLAYAYEKNLLDQAEGKIAAMYQKAGDLVAGKKNYFGALPYYKFAVSAYHVMTSPDPKKFAQTGTTLLDVYFKGSMEQLMKFRQALIKPLSLPGPRGIDKISLEDLIEKVQTDPAVTGTEREVSNMLHDTLLDATIYFGDCSGWGSIFTYPEGTPKDQKKDPVTQGGQDLLSSYTEKYKISFDTVSSVTATLKRVDFETLMQNAFNSFNLKVLQATSEQDRLIGFAAIQQLTNTLYFALGKIYMTFYLSSLDPGKQYEQWLSAISAEKQNIIAPPQQWLGKE